MEEGQEILDKRYKVIKKLGSGAFGEIYKVEKMKTGDNSCMVPLVPLKNAAKANSADGPLSCSQIRNRIHAATSTKSHQLSTPAASTTDSTTFLTATRVTRPQPLCDHRIAAEERHNPMIVNRAPRKVHQRRPQ